MKSMFLKSLFVVVMLVLVGLLTLLTGVRTDIPVEQLISDFGSSPSRFVDVGSCRVHYRDEGAGEPLVLIHGTFSSLHTWDGWVQSLSPLMRTIRFDLPGFGLTGACPERNYSIADYVEWLELFRKHLGLESFSCAGNSLGGWIAWEYALRYPDRIRKLILLDSAGYPLEHIPFIINIAGKSPLSFLVRWLTPRILVEMNLRQVYGDSGKITPELIDRYARLMRRTGNREAFLQRASAKDPDHSSQLPSLNIPVLIQWGEVDRWIPLSYAHQFEGDIPAAQLITYSGVGHVPMEEIPDRSAADALDFLTSPGDSTVKNQTTDQHDSNQGE